MTLQRAFLTCCVTGTLMLTGWCWVEDLLAAPPSPPMPAVAPVAPGTNAAAAPAWIQLTIHFPAGFQILAAANPQMTGAKWVTNAGIQDVAVLVPCTGSNTFYCARWGTLGDPVATVTDANLPSAQCAVVNPHWGR